MKRRGLAVLPLAIPLATPTAAQWQPDQSLPLRFLAPEEYRAELQGDAGPLPGAVVGASLAGVRALA